MKICIVIARPDALTKVGGDTIQAQSIATYLNKIPNVLVSVEAWSPQWRPDDFDLIHIFNDRPLFLNDIMERCKSQKLKVLISPIHHSFNEILKLRLDSVPFVYAKRKIYKMLYKSRLKNELCHILNISFDILLLIKTLGMRTTLRYLSKPSFIFFRVSKFNEIFRLASQTIVLAEGEKLSLQNDYKLEVVDCKKIFNGVPLIDGSMRGNKLTMPHKIIVVGRIEKRKRQLMIAKLAEKQGIPITFIGAISSNQSKYGRQFEKVLQESRFVNYFGELSHIEVLATMKNSRVLFSASLSEVLSLVEIEALSLGLHVVTTGVGYTNELANSKNFSIYDDEDVLSGLMTAKTMTELQSISTDSRVWPSWEEIANEYLNSYYEILGTA